MPIGTGGKSSGGTFPLNKALIDTDIYSEILKAVDQTVTRNAMANRQRLGILTVSTITVMEANYSRWKREFE
jgi:predicted nucleic acid-binding protein